MIKKLLAGKKLINVGKGEMKIALVIIFVVINGIINMSVYARGHVVSNPLRNFEEHLICESMGESAACPPFEESEISGLTIAGGVIASFIPVVVLLVTCDLRACKKLRKSKTSKNVTSTRSN